MTHLVISLTKVSITTNTNPIILTITRSLPPTSIIIISNNNNNTFSNLITLQCIYNKNQGLLIIRLV